MSIGAFCPNLEDPEIREQFEGIAYNLNSTDLAYHFWDKYKGDVIRIYEEISERQQEEYFSKHPDPKIQAAIEQYGEKEITNINNPYVWDVEEELGLVEKSPKTAEPELFPSKKKRVLFTSAKANRLIHAIHKKGLFATRVEVRTARGTMRKFKVIASHDINRDPGDVFLREGVNHVVIPEDVVPLEHFINVFYGESHPSVDIVQYLEDNYKEIIEDRPDLAAVFQMVKHNKSKLKHSTLFVEPVKREAYMTHKEGHIVININAVLKRPNLEFFIESILHEMVHAMTFKAMFNPETDAERTFMNTIEELYLHVVNNYADIGYEYGMTTSMEFIAEMMVDRQFADKMSKIYRTVEQTDTRSILQRFLDAVLEFLGITERKDRTSPKNVNVYEIVRNSFEMYMKSSPSVGIPSRISSSGRILDNYDSAVQNRIQQDTSKVEPGNPESIRKALIKIGKQFDQVQLEKEHKYYHVPTGAYFDSTTEYMGDHGYGIPRMVRDKGLPQNIIRAANLGTTVHVTLEGNVNDIVDDIAMETGFTTNVEAKKALAKIIEDLKKETKSIIALSEVIVADPQMKRAGTIDLVLIDDKGRIRLYDFKTKEKGFAYYTKPFNAKTKSDQEKYRMQLSIYKHMIEKMLGIPVFDMNVVMLRPEVEESALEYDIQFTTEEIESISLDNSFTIEPEGKLILKEKDFGTFTKGEVIEVWSGEEVEQGAKFNLVITGKKRHKTNKEYIEYSYTYKPDVITNVTLDRGAIDFPNGIDNFNTPVKGFQGLYGERPMKFKRRLRETAGVSESTDWERSMHEHKIRQSQLTEVEDLADKAKEALVHRLEVVSSRYSFAQRKDFEDFVETVLDIDTATDTLLHIIKYAAGVTSNIMNEVKEAGKTGFTIEKLNKWTDYIIAYDTLDQILDLILEDPKLFKDPKIVQLLKDTVENKNTIKRLYKKKGIPLIAEWLTPYYDRIRREFQNDQGSDYRVLVKKMKKRGKTEQEIIAELGTEEQFVDAKLAEHNETLDEMTYDLLKQELIRAARDISVGARWLDNVLDSSDVVISAMVNAFMEADDAVRLESLAMRTEFLNHLRELEKAKGKGVVESEIDFYKFGLELDENGKPKQYLLMPWKSAIHEEERLERQDAFRNYSKKVAKDRIKQWKAAHLELFKDDYYEAYNEYLISLLKAGDISQKEYDTLLDNLYAVNIPIEDLMNNGKISEDAGNLALGWLDANRWKYSKVHEDYANPQWTAWIKSLGIDPNLKQWEQMEAVEKSDHPEAKFYTFIKKLGEDADSKLPYSHQLGTRLPGVAKISSERIKEGQDPLTYFKETAKADMFIRPEDTERGNAELTDEHGNPKYFLPIHYTAELEPENQSFDLAGIYYRYWQSATDYKHKKQILAKMEMAKKFVDERIAIKRDSLGNIIKRAARTVGVGDQKERPTIINNTQLAAQFNDWFLMAVYGKKSTNKSIISMFGKELDVSKLISSLTSYTSLNLLAFNTVQATANVVLGETMQKIDSFAGEHVNPKSMLYGTDYYMRNLPKMMGDIAARNKNSTASLLIERFDIMHEDVRHDTTFSKRSRVGQILDSSTLFWLQAAGEHWMQSRFLFAMLHDKRAYNEKGEDIGPLIKQYYSKDGVLKINKEVHLIKSKWTEKDQQVFKRKVKGLLSRMHGEYSDLGRVAAQRYVLGQLAYQFRKFIVPGIRRRYGRRTYIQRLDQFVEGNYITTAKFAYSLVKDLGQLNLALMAEDWAALSKHEKANVKRTVGEAATLLALFILISAMWRDDDEEADYGTTGALGIEWMDTDWLNSFMEYQAERLSTELGFFTRTGEAMKILRSPAATMSVAENTARFFNNLFNFNEYYERGPWAGQRKITKNVVNYVPVYRQYYRLRDVKDQIQWLR